MFDLQDVLEFVPQCDVQPHKQLFQPIAGLFREVPAALAQAETKQAKK